MDIKIPGKAWIAIEQADNAIDFLNIFIDFKQYIQLPQYDVNWIEEKKSDVQACFFKTVRQLKDILKTKKSVDPAILKYSNLLSPYIDFKSEINTADFHNRTNAVDKLLPAFRNNYVRYNISLLDTLLNEAKKEMASTFSVSFEDLQRDLFHLTFDDRAALEKKGIFRTRQKFRHRIFSSRRRTYQEYQSAYQTPKLDEYLLLRDIRAGLLRKWGRFMPVTYNHLLIKFYRNPDYWNNHHMFLKRIDYLRLGFAYFQYTMEMADDSEFSRMSYRNALDCFSKSNFSLLPELRKILW